MAPKKRNHYVPKWLLRRFTCPDSKNHDQIWMLRTEGKPIHTHINNAGSCNYFYGDPENGLEEIFSRLDDRDSTVLSTIEHADDLAPHSEPICRMVRLMLIRTRSLRQKFTDTTMNLFKLLEESASNPEILPYLRAHLASIFDEEFEKSWNQQPPSIRSLLPKIAARELMREQLEQLDLNAAMVQIFGQVKDKIPWHKAAEEGHNTGLLKLVQDVESESIPEGWLQLKWQIIRFSDTPLILGDCVVFAVRGNPALALNGSDAGKSPAGVCMPIAPDALLVGTIPDQPYLKDPPTINEASAAHSFDSFFASEIPKCILDLTTSLGKMQGLLASDEIDELSETAWKNLGRDS